MSDEKDKNAVSSGDGFRPALKKRSFDAIAGGIVTLVTMLLVARFSGAWNGIVSAWQRDAGSIKVNVPELMDLGANYDFDPQIVPQSSKIMHGQLRVKVYTDNVTFSPAVTEFAVMDVSKPMFLSEFAKSKIKLDAAREGSGVIELQLVSNDRPLDRVVKLIAVRAPCRGKWRFWRGDQEGQMDVYQSDGDVFGTYTLAGEGYGTFVGHLEGNDLTVRFSDSKAPKRWDVNGSVEQSAGKLLIHRAPANAVLYAAKDEGWMQTGTTSFSATKAD